MAKSDAANSMLTQAADLVSRPVAAIAISQGVSFMNHRDIKNLRNTTTNKFLRFMSTSCYLFNMSSNQINHKKGAMSLFLALRYQY